MPDVVRIVVGHERDIVSARQKGRKLAASIGFSSIDQTLIATAISELARNIVTYAKTGDVLLAAIEEDGLRGVLVVARDDGPGIPDVNLALQDGWSSSTGLGLGLPGARRLVDDFDLVTTVGKGTTVTLKKWLR
jgi:serine/threonine-protein kinase RsbT